MGGSLGGLTAALVLRDIGCDVDVFDRSRTPLESRGAGIVLHPATVRYLMEKRVFELSQVSAAARWFRYLNADGSVAQQERCRYRFTSYYTLYRGLLRCFDESRYQLGQAIIDFKQDADLVTVRFEDGREETCELLVCADGIHSTAREILLPEVIPDYSGYVGWRGTVGEDELSDDTFAILHEAITYFVMPHSPILAYPIPSLDGSTEPGRRLTNFVWYRNVTEGDELDALLTGRNGVHYKVSLSPGLIQDRHLTELRETARSRLPPPLSEMVLETEHPFVQVVFDIEVPRMAFGRICLIGDAAFALRPHAAAGTAKAAEDSWKLAEVMKETDFDVPSALKRWEAGQLALGRRVLKRTREAGNRSQFECTWKTGDPLPFGLYEIGDSALE
jgi:2,6-dihydroxypyridine 3-monooxygenase